MKRILLVDDDAEDRFIVADALESVGRSSVLFSAENGEKAIEALAGISETSRFPCLIVLDLNMPKMSGTDTLNYLKSHESYRHIPVIIYSTSENALEKKKCLSLGAFDYLTKPTSMKEWKKIIDLFLSFCD